MPDKRSLDRKLGDEAFDEVFGARPPGFPSPELRAAGLHVATPRTRREWGYPRRRWFPPKKGQGDLALSADPREGGM